MSGWSIDCWTFLCFAAMSVLDCARFLGGILYWLGYVRVAFGALNVESQCSWAAVTVLDRVLTMSSWSLVEAKMHAKVSIGSCGILWVITVTAGLRSRGVCALNVDSQCSWAAVTVLDRVLTMSSWSLVEAKMHAKVSIGSCGILWEITVTVGVRSRDVWRSLCCESVFLSCRTAAARGDSTGAVLGPGGALGLAVSFLMLPGASVCGLVFSHPEAHFCVQCRSWCASATDLGEIAEVFHSCDVELIVVRQYHRSWVSRSGRCHTLCSSPELWSFNVYVDLGFLLGLAMRG